MADADADADANSHSDATPDSGTIAERVSGSFSGGHNDHPAAGYDGKSQLHHRDTPAVSLRVGVADARTDAQPDAASTRRRYAC